MDLHTNLAKNDGLLYLKKKNLTLFSKFKTKNTRLDLYSYLKQLFKFAFPLSEAEKWPFLIGVFSRKTL